MSSKRVVIGVLALVALLVGGALPWWLAGIATTRRFEFPDRENAGLTPASFQLPFEEASFASADGVGLRGWWVPAPGARGTVVLVHGLNRTRVENARKLPFLHAQGWNTLLFDLRHHGQSGGQASTFGWREKDDVAAAVALARRQSAGPVVAWGVSMGAAAATLAAAEDPAISGLVCDSSFRSLRDTVWHHLELFRGFRWWGRLVPAWAIGSQAIYFIGVRGSFDPDAVDVLSAARRLGGRPALFVANSGDRRMPSEIAGELSAAAGPQARVLVVPGHSHGGAWREGTQQYEAAVRELLERVAGPVGLAHGAPAGAAQEVPGGLERRSSWEPNGHAWS